jgi:RNA polymerase sigma-70 factor (ECF subfamily)
MSLGDKDSAQPSPPAKSDRAEFFALYTRHSRQLYGYLRALVPQQADADDAFQEVSAVLWEKFDDFQPGSNFVAWAMQVAKYCVLNWRDRQRRLPVSLSDAFLEAVALESAGMTDLLEAQHRALADCYQQLPVEQRDLLDQRYRASASVKQLAEETKRPLRTVYRLLEQIHSALMQCIERKLHKEGAK